MSPPSVEYFFSFRSPYSYLSAPRVFELPRHYDIELIWRGVRPMAMRGQPLPRAKQLYILRDAAREAQRLGLPFGPIFDPLGEGVWRCLCVAEYAKTQSRLADFVIRSARAIWGEGQDVRRDAVLRALCERSGLDWSACQDALSNPQYRARIEANTERLASLGHWGVPTLAYAGTLYWGQDRIDDLAAALSHAGLRRREEVAA